MSAELEARRTAAAAVLADFHQTVDAYLDEGKPRPDYGALAGRLAVELGALLAQLARETSASKMGGFDLVIRQALRDATRWQHATRTSDDPDGQIGIYLSAARYFGLDLGRGLTAAEAPDLMARQAQIRLVLDLVLGDELADRQYALEQIDGILRGER